MQNIPLDKAELLAIFLETLVYGMFLSLYIMLLLVLLRLGPAGRAKRRTMLPVGTILFVLATAHLVIDFVRILDGFVYEPGGPMVYFSNIAHPLFTAKTVLYVTQTLIGDGVMIWRCYMVYNKKLWVIAVPGIVLLVNACAGYLVCYELSHATHGTTVFQTAASWIATFFSLTMAINVSCTAVIALRIYMSGSLSGSIHSLMPALIAIVESGALYSSGVMGLLIAYCRNSNGQYPALDVVQRSRSTSMLARRVWTRLRFR
ncbi:hypothetical protein EWM64_g1144 [Hericium alpestre]|uniref:G-protein coupled receptors family 1 profile domain-containing protein n=1 Tax=Hericium alpestre TaxID=135208 RepID=A0A4Z0A735_9AGAM|nr:hypothetical protein EWM64_g1144 [Hericium alpestre]